MRLKPFGESGAKVSEIGMGTYYDPLWIAGAMVGWRRGAGSKLAALKAGLEGGINFIDSAELYGSEPIVADAIRGLKREDLFVATKVWTNHLGRDSLPKALNRSLRRLGLSYVDLYQVHFPSRLKPISETMHAMEAAKESGKILNIGVSNFSLKQMIDANEALSRSEIASNQVNYSLVHRDIEEDLLPYCERNHVEIISYYPLGHGKLAKAVDRLQPICQRNSKTPAQVALNWLSSKDVVFPIPRASRAGHVKENLGASDWRLTESERAELDRAFPR